MIQVTLSHNPEEDIYTEDRWLLDIALRHSYKNALFEISHNMWRKWKYDESELSVDTLREEISRILYDNGINYEVLE